MMKKIIVYSFLILITVFNFTASEAQTPDFSQHNGHDSSVVLTAIDPYEDERKKWEDFYYRYFGQEVDFSDVEIPEKREGFDQMIIIQKGLALNEVAERCKENFEFNGRYADLDGTGFIHERNSTQSYAIFVRKSAEPDQHLFNKSAEDKAVKKINTITLLERLVFELYWFSETWENLDQKYFTLCSGSRGPDECVPGVYCGDDDVVVVTYYWLGMKNPVLATREVIALK